MPDWISGHARAEVGKRRLGGPSHGVFAEYLCIDEAEAVRAPTHLDAAEAATLPVTAVTAWHQLHSVGRLSPGETLLVQGTGGVSTAAIQMAHASGARVVALLRSRQHTDGLRALHRIELASFNDLSVERLKSVGLISEIVSWKLRLFVPMGATGAGVLARLLDRYPLQRVAERRAAKAA